MPLKAKRKSVRSSAARPAAAKPKKAQGAGKAPSRPPQRSTGAAAKSAGKASAKRGQKPMQVFFWPTPNGHKVTIMLEECGLPYEIVPINIGAGDQFMPEFLKIAPNNRIPAFVDPAGPGGRPISIFESGAILRYLGEKTGKFYPADLRGRVVVDQWLFWQMAGLGPMAGQANHFRSYAPEKLPYAIERYSNEVNRLYGVLETRLRAAPFVGGTYSIADMAIWPWILPDRAGQSFDDFPALKAWHDKVGSRKAVQRGHAAGLDLRQKVDLAKDAAARKVLFGQRARVA